MSRVINLEELGYDDSLFEGEILDKIFLEIFYLIEEKFSGGIPVIIQDNFNIDTSNINISKAVYSAKIMGQYNTGAFKYSITKNVGDVSELIFYANTQAREFRYGTDNFYNPGGNAGEITVEKLGDFIRPLRKDTHIAFSGANRILTGTNLTLIPKTNMTMADFEKIIYIFSGAENNEPVEKRLQEYTTTNGVYMPGTTTYHSFQEQAIVMALVAGSDYGLDYKVWNLNNDYNLIGSSTDNVEYSNFLRIIKAEGHLLEYYEKPQDDFLKYLQNKNELTKGEEKQLMLLKGIAPKDMQEAFEDTTDSRQCILNAEKLTIWLNS